MAWCFTGELLNTLENSFKYCLSLILFHFFLFFVFLSLFLFYFVLFFFSVFVCVLPKSTVILFYKSDPVLGAIILIVWHPDVLSVFS